MSDDSSVRARAMSGPMADDPITVAILAEVERVHPTHLGTRIPTGMVAVTAPEPCERCGTRVFALQFDDLCSPPQVCHVGSLRNDSEVQTVRHTPELCREVRDGGEPLEGRPNWLCCPDCSHRSASA